MPVKYVCPKCGRRFAEWGAEKIGFKCPGDQWCPADRPDAIELVRVGAQEDRPVAKKPTLKRPAKRAVAVPSSMTEDEVIVPDIEDIEVETEAEESEIDEIEGEDEEVLETEEEGVETPVEADDDSVAGEDEDSLDVDGDAGVDDTLEDAADIVDEDWKE